MTPIKAYAKSVIVNGRPLFPLTDPKIVAAQLEVIIGEIESRAYERGRRDVAAEMKKLLRV